MYCNRLEELGLEIENRIHSTQFKERMLSSYPNLVSYKSGRDVYVSFPEDVGAMRITKCVY